jgi:hypothetical protein
MAVGARAGRAGGDRNLNVTAGCKQTTGFGGGVCWWDEVPWFIRNLIRGLWSTLSGQPLTRDLFPSNHVPPVDT